MKTILPGVITTAVFLLSGHASFAQQEEPQFGKDPIKEIIKKMTLEEKVKIVVGKGFSLPGMNMGSNDNTPDKIFAVSGHTIPIAKFGIPNISMADGPSGIHRWAMTAKDSANNAFSTAWPVGTLLASNGDTTIIHKGGVVFQPDARKENAR